MEKEMRRIVEKDPWGFCDRIYWCGWSSKMIFNLVSDFIYGEKKRKQKLVMGILQSSKKLKKKKRISKEMRDEWRRWLISLRKLLVTGTLPWSCYVTAKKRAIVSYLQ